MAKTKQVPLKMPKVPKAPAPKAVKMPKPTLPKQPNVLSPAVTGLPSVLQPGKATPAQKAKKKMSGGGGVGSGNTGVML